MPWGGISAGVEKYSDLGYVLKVELRKFADEMDASCESDESWKTAGFWIQSTGKMELPFTEQGRTAGEWSWNVWFETPICHLS